MTPAFHLEGITVRYGAKNVLYDITCGFAPGEFIAIAGPNGAGKSTLIGIMSGLRDASTGVCRYQGKELRKWDRKAFAREIAVVPQSVRIDFPFTAEQVVLMGRAPFASSLFESDEDRYQVTRVMQLTGTSGFRDRDFRTLSGGEKQRVIVASALAQMPSVLLLDEPAAFLDIEHQLGLYRLLRTLAASEVLVIAVTHDLNLAAAHTSRVVLLQQGQVAADGEPAEVLNAATIKKVFNVEADIRPSAAGRPWIQYGG